MTIREEKGFTGIDMTIAIMILVLFTGIIAALFYNYNLSAKEIERKSKATEIAIDEIEEIKNADFEIYANCSSDEGKDEKKGIIYKDEKVEDGYYKTVQIIDYSDIEKNEEKQFGLVKKATVIITYKVENKERTVEISTVISKEI